LLDEIRKKGMSHFTGCDFEGKTVVLDGHEYVHCKFRHCRIVVTRGNFVLKSSGFEDCVFDFGGEAENIKKLVLGIAGQSTQEPSGTTDSEAENDD